MVSSKGVYTDPHKVQAVQEFPVPANVMQLRSFIGLTSYYCRFIKNYAWTARPLYALAWKSQKFISTRECQTAFDELKELLISAPVLSFPDFTCPFILETDASLEGLGAVLFQRMEDNKIHPIAYTSQTVYREWRRDTPVWSYS